MFFPHHNTSFSSRPSSRPVSRPVSPTRTNTRTSVNSSHSGSSSHPTPIPSSHSNSFRGASSHGTPVDTSDFDAYDTPPSSIGAVPAYGPYTPTTDMGWSSGYNTPGGSLHHNGSSTPGGSMYHGSSTPGYGSLAHAAHHSLEIVLDSDKLVMRGAGGDMNPAYLSGRVELDLSEKTNVKEIIMNLTGKAKVQFADNVGSKHHHHSHVVVNHDWSFLEGDKKHNHTLKAGHHSFPFQLMLDSALPSSLHTFAGEGQIQYKLRATVVRPGFTATNYLASKTFDLQRTYTSDALEFNQTLEIENTWPGKVMYSLSLPFKAFAAGDDIPVAVKFMPLAKGVKVTAVTSVLKEYTSVATRHSTHSDTRVAAGCKHEFREGRAKQVSEETLRPPTHSTARWADVPIRRPSTNLAGMSNAAAGPSTPADPANMTDEQIAAAAAAEVMSGDDEVNTFFSLYVPPWVTPTHTVHPVTITHKLKWSCTITNPDGHISELRCALPIIILDHSLLEEARSAGANTRALLLGETIDEAQNVDLPSYSNHVYDRVAADSGPATGYTSRSSRTPTGTHTPVTPTSPHSRPVSRPSSRPSSRPASPVRRDSVIHDLHDNPPRRTLDFEADSELLRALGALEAHSISPTPSATPGGSRAPSRPLSRRGSFTRSGRSSNVNSRPGSRAASPDRSHPSSASGSLADESHVRPGTERRGTSFAQRLHLPHSLKPMKALSSRPILRNASGADLAEANVPRNASFSALSSTSGASSPGHVSFHPKTARHDGRRFFGTGAGSYFGSGSRSGGSTPSGSGGVGFHLGPDSPHISGSPDGLEGEPDVDPISRVPNYDIARYGFASDLANGPPTYDSSNALEEETARTEAVKRTRSDSALVEMAAAAAEMDTPTGNGRQLGDHVDEQAHQG